MSTFFGGSEVSGMYLGSNEISEMYLGSNLIYSSSSVWPYETLRISMDGGVTWEDYGRPADVGVLQFANMGITNLELPDSITSIGALSFMGNELESLDIPESVQIIDFSAFEENNLTYVEFPETLKLIKDLAFAINLYLTEVRISSRTSYTETGEGATFDSKTKIITY